MPAAVGALVIVGVLVTGGFYMARQELRIGVASKHAAMAVNVAQMGANAVMANWTGYMLGKIPILDSASLSGTVPSGNWDATVTNLNNHVYFIDVTGQVTEGGALWAGATRRIGILSKMLYAEIDPPAALTTRGETKLTNNTSVQGEDADPGPWGGFCSGTTEHKPGIVTDDLSLLDAGGVVTGDPAATVEDPTIVDETFTTFGNMTWDDLVTLAKAEGKDVTGQGANISVVEPVVSGATCVTAAQLNWGDPLNPTAPCGAYFPLIYHGGPSVTMQSGGFGQGILLVDGDLTLRGGFEFYGVVIVQGAFGTAGSGGRVFGGVMASNAALDSQDFVGGSAVNNSTCSVERAILNNASLSRARPIDTRSWIDLSFVVN
jgi:hypothetical protein